LTAAIIPLADNPLLYLPIHIIWIELIIHPTAMLVYQNLPTSTGLLRVQKDGKPKFFNLKSWFLIGLTGIILTVIISGGFQYALVSSGYDDEHARSIALGILIASNSSITVALSGLRNWSSKIISVISLSILILLVQVPSLSTLVHLKPLHLADWGIVGASAFVAWLFARIIRTQLKG
jgi:Ca2+-transporting ATPase